MGSYIFLTYLFFVSKIYRPSGLYPFAACRLVNLPEIEKNKNKLDGKRLRHVTRKFHYAYENIFS